MRGYSTWTCSRVARTSFDRLVRCSPDADRPVTFCCRQVFDLRKTTNP
ncbi:hypothetical protein BZL30_1621 [Mycobacterium kansasii]|uniref:Uncharacterized protein n=1 Tax=Mycobacterium kansasii TaxID=1768 RepID=A0A1V3XJY9_MYCKA|nr:hypothetical protein BZL30_1621 [Mycobacterium kansasii]